MFNFRLSRKAVVGTFLAAMVIAYVFLLPSAAIFPVFAQTADELQSKIDARNEAVKSLEKEIASYQKQINTLDSQASSLSSTIKSLDLTQKKLADDIAVTQNKIEAKNLEIESLSGKIGIKEANIEEDQRIISRSFSIIAQTSDVSMAELILGSKSISNALESVDDIGKLQKNLYDKINALNADKTSLETSKLASEKAQSDLLALQKQLNDQKKAVIATTAEKKDLLKSTNQSETNYKKVLADKKAQQEALQQEITAYESQLHLLVNPNLIPHTGTGVLAWPLDQIFITQYFGNTPFATANPQIYSGRGHTGVDFRASIGTPVKAALSGTVVGVADTDQYPGCYSYGKWIMIKHDNGLSTLYAHLSVQSVAVGQQVQTGQILGYSGNTGYSTGPHLHFGVYATQGVQIKLFDSSLHCQGALIPVADFKAYLNPLSYL